MCKAAQARIWRAMLRHLADGRWYALRDAAMRAGESLRDLRAALREFVRMGAPIQRDAYRGMRFLQPVSALRERRQRPPCALEEHFVLDSTNTRALQALGAGLQQRRLWLAEMQTAGRGRAGRAWHQRRATQDADRHAGQGHEERKLGRVDEEERLDGRLAGWR